MTESGNGQSWFGAWPGFLMALLLTMGAVLVQSPLQPDRPSEVRAGLPMLGTQDIDARLWQDPFAAVDVARKAAEIERNASGTEERNASGTEERNASGTEDHDIPWLARQIVSRPVFRESGSSESPPGDHGSQGVEVLAILVGGGPSIGYAERRRRDRYAALSGLMLEGFLPDDPEHIGYVKLGNHAPPEYAPFEWFSPLPSEAPKDRPERDLLLLWIDQDGVMQPPTPREALPANTSPDPSTGMDAEAPDDAAMSDNTAGHTLPPEQPSSTTSGPRILARLSRIFGEILAGASNHATRIHFSVIGPRDSTGLKAIAAESASYASNPDTACTVELTTTANMWSPFATIPDVPPPPDRRRGVCDCAPAKPCVSIRPPGPGQRPIADDGVLVDLLVTELQRRHVGINSGVALVGQWDTAYSRTLAKRFKDKWPSDHRIDKRRGPERVFQFSYMRGLDGAVPGDKTPNSNHDQDKSSARGIERATGDAQLDYLRRMRDALLDKHAQLRADCILRQRFSQDCGIRAIGVLGNDYFDKLLVLKALKPVFGSAIFFTTDLDADMLHPEDNKATRNLIVASGFGLDLKHQLQREVPPLRDSYQTALLLAVRLALTPQESENLAIPPPARLFEIGRTRAVELVTNPKLRDSNGFLRPVPGSPTAEEPEKAAPADRDPHPQEELNAYYRLSSEHASASIVAGVAAVLLALVLLAMTLGPYRVVRTLVEWWKAFSRSPAAMGVVAFSLTPVILLAAGAAVDLASGGEPLSFLQGVSIWPAETLRLMAGLAAIIFLVTGHRRLRRERIEIERDFRLEPDAQWPNHREAPGPRASVESAPQPSDSRPEAISAPADHRGPEMRWVPPQSAPAESNTQASELSSGPASCGSDLHDRAPTDPPPAEPADIWRRYIARCRVLPRWMVPKDLRHCLTERCAPGWDHRSITTRLSFQVMLFFLLAMTLMVALGFPNRPVRSHLAWQIDFAVIVLVLIPFLTLLFYVIDATRQTLILAGELAGPVCWPAQTLARLGVASWSRTPEGKTAYPGDVDWLDVRLIARVTRAVGDLVWYPVLVLIVLALGRHPMFDALDLPPALVILMSVVLLSVIACAWALRRAAERVRATALRNLGQARLRAQAHADRQASCIAQLDTMLKWVATERDGAFRPFSQQPVVHALLALASSVSGIALIEYSSIISL